MRGKTVTGTGENTHTHNKCMGGGHMTQMVVGEDVLSLVYRVSAGLHYVGLNFPVSSTDQHLEGGHGRRGSNECARTRFYMGTRVASFSGC